MEVNKKAYNVQEAAKVLGVSVPKMYQLCHTKDFPVVRLGTRIIIPIDRFDKWLDECCAVNAGA